MSPSHTKFLCRRFENSSSDELSGIEQLAGDILKLSIGREEEFCTDYAWLCEEMTREELYFRRNKKYRLNTFQEAIDEIYSNTEYMSRYINGLLLTQLWWGNHTQAILYYQNKFLTGNPKGHSHLEIGPGHGLLLSQAINAGLADRVEAWDISIASIEATTKALKSLGITKMPNIILQDMFENPSDSFDSIVFSEVLEHMEDPGGAVEVLLNCLNPEGRLFINIPINSPAPDHLFNLDEPEDVLDFLMERGLEIVEHAFFPATNYTLEAARKKKLSITCAIIARRKTA